MPAPEAGQLGFNLCAVLCPSSPCNATPIAGGYPHLCSCHLPPSAAHLGGEEA